MLCKKLSDRSVQSKRERAGLKHFGGSRTVLGGKRNSNPESLYIFVILGRTGIGKKNESPTKKDPTNPKQKVCLVF